MNESTLHKASSSWTITETSDVAVCDLVQGMLQASEPHWQQAERRERKRHPFPLLMTLTPIADQEMTAVDEPIVVVGRHLALRGLDFYHREPLPYRRAIISFDELPGQAHLVLLISWCRFLRPGWYDSGGRFTHVVQPHPEPAGKSEYLDIE